MTIALISTNPYKVEGAYPDDTTQFELPNENVVEGAQVGWTGEGFALVAVAAEAYRLAAERLHGQFART